ncbi:MAG: serine hydrolase domain-containing protein [Sediminibacterium sp.]|jgi:CubicO group peptidase (beta-lactamase class C family)|nr:beta-lactamase family protein [Chitinophagaceae bacterium]MCA6441013.1 beta-lactamase family protein [Chitinophagaceae bacterium]MCA6446242.1 beta-lactamase family protein [Chitinophagaceae bacterium]
MHKKIFLLSIFIIFKVAIHAQGQVIGSIIDSFVKKEQFSGVVLVADKGSVVFNKAYGYRNFAETIPLKHTDIFELASVSKQFTAMAIMILQERGKLDIDDSVNQYLTIPYTGITIRHLLNHTSGLPDYQAIMDTYWDKNKVAGNSDILAYLNLYKPPKLFSPGEQYNYSNTGYVLLASIAEKVSGTDFIEFCRKEIFQKLGMKDTDIRSLEEKARIKNFALGHIYVPERNQFIRSDSFPSSNYTIWLGNRKGPGRISSTAEDLLKWDQALYTQKLVKLASLEAAFTPAELNNGTFSNYGFGWEIKTDSLGNKYVLHNGDNPGYKTQIVRFLHNKKTLIVLCNNAITGFPKLIAKLEDALNN